MDARLHKKDLLICISLEQWGTNGLSIFWSRRIGQAEGDNFNFHIEYTSQFYRPWYSYEDSLSIIRLLPIFQVHSQVTLSISLYNLNSSHHSTGYSLAKPNQISYRNIPHQHIPHILTFAFPYIQRGLK